MAAKSSFTAKTGPAFRVQQQFGARGVVHDDNHVAAMSWPADSTVKSKRERTIVGCGARLRPGFPGGGQPTAKKKKFCIAHGRTPGAH
jgi:hypothetical protein